ncbi:transposase [Micromonospora sp. NPDC047074]|uniref:transposase n=1 Tax=Micromonospora sp. NPDC047074 TaxID=3154339 RepID=UPI0033CACF10
MGVARTRIAWKCLPHDFPPAKTVYDFYAKWEADGATQRIRGQGVGVDGGYDTAVRAHGARLGIDVEAVPRHARKGFHVQPRRWGRSLRVRQVGVDSPVR